MSGAVPNTRIPEYLNTEDILDLLARLIDKSLLVSEYCEGEGRAGRRYRVLETIRQYALLRLAEAGEETVARERHARFFLGLAGEGRAHLGAVAWLQRMDTEYPNVRAALDLGLMRPGLSSLAVRAGAALYVFWTLRGYHREGRRWWERALEIDGRLSSVERSLALTAVGELACYHSEFEVAETAFEAAIPAARAAQARVPLAWALMGLGRFARVCDDRKRARQYLTEGLEVAREARDSGCVGSCLVELGWISLAEGAATGAGALAEEASALFRKQDDPFGMIGALQLAGVARAAEGRPPEEARGLLFECLEVCRAVGDRINAARTLADLGPYFAVREG